MFLFFSRFTVINVILMIKIIAKVIAKANAGPPFERALTSSSSCWLSARRIFSPLICSPYSLRRFLKVRS